MNNQATTAIQDTIAAVFRQHAYDRTISETLWSRFWAWLGRHLMQLFNGLHSIPALRTAVAIALCALALAIIIRIIYLLVTEESATHRTRGGAGLGAALVDPWVEAQRLAASGDYTGAAHSLYAALLDALAHRDPVRLHSSKTVGDYARELRRLSSPRFPGFREFARAYEVVVYGLGSCDRARYDRLLSLATPLVQPTI